jgi:hypothetical protein
MIFKVVEAISRHERTTKIEGLSNPKDHVVLDALNFSEALRTNRGTSLEDIVLPVMVLSQAQATLVITDANV